jgi:hypothetical protein
MYDTLTPEQRGHGSRRHAGFQPEGVLPHARKTIRGRFALGFI